MKQAQIVLSLEAILPYMFTAGARFAVPVAELGGETLFEVYEVGSDSRAGMGGLAESLINLGTVAAQFGAQKAAANKAGSQQEREINNAFDSVAREVNQHFVAALNKGATITPADYNAALDAYQKLAAFAAQYPTKGITEWWNSPSYNASYQNMLATLQSRLTTGGTVATGGGTQQPNSSGNTVQTSGASGLFDSPYIIPAVIVGAVLFLKR
jgi:hypothetical protein